MLIFMSAPVTLKTLFISPAKNVRCVLQGTELRTDSLDVLNPLVLHYNVVL